LSSLINLFVFFFSLIDIQSEDFGSETETSSGIFNRIRRQNKKSQKAMSKSSAGSEDIESDVNGIKKPLIAKWKVGNQKLQVNNRSANDGNFGNKLTNKYVV
jgi:hypothetical protein